MTGIAAIVLAAGRGARYHAAGGAEPTKLVAAYAGEAMVRRAAAAALASQAAPVIVVTGHAQTVVEAALHDLSMAFVHNPDFASGLAGSIRIGIAAIPASCVGAVILLGDMPAVDAMAIDRLVATAVRHPEVDAVAAAHRGVRGNPVLLSRRLFGRVSAITGDTGARGLLRQTGLRVIEVELGPAVLLDIDEPGHLAAADPGMTSR